MVVVAGEKYIEEIIKAPDDVLSIYEALDRTLQMNYTLGRDINVAPFHLEVIRKSLTRNIGERFADMFEELEMAFNEYIPRQTNRASSVP